MRSALTGILEANKAFQQGYEEGRRQRALFALLKAWDEDGEATFTKAEAARKLRDALGPWARQ